MTTLRRRFAFVVGVLAATAVPMRPAHADGPAVVVAPNAVMIGRVVTVTVTGFTVGRPVVVTLCGNDARRGSVDCDLAGSVAFPISRFDQVHAVSFPIGTPPVPCPCVVRVSNTPGRDVASAPVTIAGFPTGPLINDGVTQPLTLAVSVTRAPESPIAWLRSFVGGRTSYNVNVTVRNRSTEPVEHVRLLARAGRSPSDQARRVSIAIPNSVPAGEAIRSSKRVTLSAPVVGRFHWTVTAIGDGALAKSTQTTSRQPVGLYLLLVALVGDISWMALRRVRRRKRSEPVTFTSRRR